VKNEIVRVLGVELCMTNRAIGPGDRIGVLLPKDTEVKRGDILVKHSWADIGVSNCFENNQV